ncbi:DUF669 domain-containing protein [Sinorhizobium meliloti]|uniref:DUF669 domain-containing protein n=1 Tax=Rhizobium meliloti TaxID=382 RepID=UPI002380A5BE|nr:DUF669 domain-containing protein [Sinorhizobium meliloti]MDE3796946.1 DUF669 domain-containing protein [Sinorhizobium meliloti]
MARLGNAFDATAHDTTQSDYSELPSGVYKLEIEASDVVPTKAGTGTILKTTMSVLEPESHKGRKLFTTYNLENQNPQAQEIGQKQFASLCRAIGVSSVEDSEDLHFHAFTAKIGLGKAQNGYPARAEVKRYYFEDEGNVPEPAIDAVQPTPAAAPANDNRQAAARPAAAAAPAGGARKNPWSK